MATLLVYLTDVDEGGETCFPQIRSVPTTPAAQGAASWYLKANGGLCIRPKRGTALLFFNLHGSGGLDKFGQPICLNSTSHVSQPVIRGSKHVLQRWYHFKHGPYRAVPGLHTICDPSMSCREYLEDFS